jgi:hypothetical protein
MVAENGSKPSIANSLKKNELPYRTESVIRKSHSIGPIGLAVVISEVSSSG